MDRPANTILRIGDWRVTPASGELSRNGETVRVETRTMRLLLCLAERPGEVVSIEELLDKAWPGVNVSPDSVYQAVASLRRLLGDDPKQPTYIATVPRLGYRMLAAVGGWTYSASSPQDSATNISVPKLAASNADSNWQPSSLTGADSIEPGKKSASVRASRFLWGLASFACVALVAGLLLYRGGLSRTQATAGTQATQPEKSIAVLAFLDLTPGMKEEEFADGLTEEIIDKLSKIPGVRVPAATASFYFKYKKIPVDEIAKRLGVVYIVDGSTRQSGDSVRIAARLVRAENGYVIWSETYDRPFVNRVAVQDEIAAKVTEALRSSVETVPRAENPHP